MKKFFNWMMAAILICGAISFTACSSDDDGKKAENLTPEMLAGLWVADYAENGQDGNYSWNRVVEDYLFNGDGTGYYECYRLNGEKFVNAVSVRDNGALHFTISGNTVTITGDENNMTQTLTYADGKLTVQGKTLQKATAEQQTLVNQLYADWSGGNSGTEGEVAYIERSWDGEKVVDKEVTTKAQWLNEIQVEGGQEKALSGTWYVTGQHKIQGFLKVEQGKTLDIILCDYCELSLPSIRVEGGTFRLFGQSQELGMLLVGNIPEYFELSQGAAIGAHQVNGGTIEIHSGNIIAFGGDYGAGVGGYMYRTIGSVKIYGGSHWIQGGKGAAGIGAPPYALVQEGKIEIFGGVLSAVGGMQHKLEKLGGGAGIGGGAVLPVESIIIYGGDITATAYHYAAGIGTGQFYDTGGSTVRPSADQLDLLKTSVIIKGGKVVAQGGLTGAGIGGGRYMTVGKIEISGGEVYAYGINGAGIGSGCDGKGQEVTISGGYVEAHGNNVRPDNPDYYSASAGIGGGYNGSGGKITICGGEVHAFGGDNGAGIGGGVNGDSGDITISGGAVEAVGGTYGAGIGAGKNGEANTITITTENGPVYVSGRSGNDCGLWAGSIGAYDADARGTLNIGNGVKVIGITGFDNGITWADIPVALNPVAWIYERCHVQLKTCDHPGYTAETCIFCKH